MQDVDKEKVRHQQWFTVDISRLHTPSGRASPEHMSSCTVDRQQHEQQQQQQHQQHVAIVTRDSFAIAGEAHRV
jgi:hypothetical protein